MTVESWSTTAPSRAPAGSTTRRLRDTVGARPWRSAPLAIVVAATLATVLVVPWFVALPLLAALPVAGRAEWRRARRTFEPVGSPAVFAFAVAGAGLVVASLLAASASTRVPLHGLELIGQFALVPLCAVACSLAPRRAVSVVAVWAGACAGAALAGLAALVQVVVLGAQRADGATNAIAFGGLSLLLVAVALALVPLVPPIDVGVAIAPRTITLAATVLGLSAVVLSGSRGPVLAVPVLLGWAVAHRRDRMTSGTVMRAVAAGGAVVAVASTLGGGVLVNRLRVAVWEVRVYRTAPSPVHPAAGTSIGARFEAWRAAAETFLENPVLGVGWGNLRGSFGLQVVNGQRHPRIAGFDHAHQQLLSTLASVGIVGGLAWLAVLSVPALWFWRAWRKGDDPDRAVGLAGLLIVSGYAVFGTTESIFEGFAPITWYAIAVAVLLAQLDPRSSTSPNRRPTDHGRGPDCLRDRLDASPMPTGPTRNR